MWSAIITSAATIGAVLYLEGPIVALGLTAVSSIALLIVLRTSDNHTDKVKPRPQPRGTLGGNDAEIMFPPLRRVS